MQHQPYPHITPIYGAKAQYVEAEDLSPPLSISDKKNIQELTGTFMYYAQAVNPNTMTALGSISELQENPTEHTMQKVKQLLDYVATHPDVILTYHASDLVLSGHSNASYLSETEPISRAGGNFFM